MLIRNSLQLSVSEGFNRDGSRLSGTINIQKYKSLLLSIFFADAVDTSVNASTLHLKCQGPDSDECVGARQSKSDTRYESLCLTVLFVDSGAR